MDDRHDDDRQVGPADHLLEALKDQLSPHAVALIAAKLAPTAARGNEIADQAERECAWFRDQLLELLGGEEHEFLTRELGI